MEGHVIYIRNSSGKKVTRMKTEWQEINVVYSTYQEVNLTNMFNRLAQDFNQIEKSEHC